MASISFGDHAKIKAGRDVNIGEAAAELSPVVIDSLRDSLAKGMLEGDTARADELLDKLKEARGDPETASKIIDTLTTIAPGVVAIIKAIVG